MKTRKLASPALVTVIMPVHNAEEYLEEALLGHLKFHRYKHAGRTVDAVEGDL